MSFRLEVTTYPTRGTPAPLPPLLQADLPGGSLLFVVGVVTVLSIALPAYYVYSDATKRDDENATLWTVATVLGGLAGSGLVATIAGALLVVVLYLILGRD